MFPKFSIRQLLGLMVVIGLFSLCMSSAARGNRVAFGFSVAVIGSVLPLAAYAIVHWVSFAFASFLALIGNRRGVNSLQPVAADGVVSDVPIAASIVEPVSNDDEGATDD